MSRAVVARRHPNLINTGRQRCVMVVEDRIGGAGLRIEGQLVLETSRNLSLVVEHDARQLDRRRFLVVRAITNTLPGNLDRRSHYQTIRGKGVSYGSDN